MPHESVEFTADSKSIKLEKGTLYVSIGAFIVIAAMIGIGSWQASTAFTNLQNGTQKVNDLVVALKSEIAGWQKETHRDISTKVDYYEIKDYFHELKVGNPNLNIPAFTRPR